MEYHPIAMPNMPKADVHQKKNLGNYLKRVVSKLYLETTLLFYLPAAAATIAFTFSTLAFGGISHP